MPPEPSEHLALLKTLLRQHGRDGAVNILRTATAVATCGPPWIWDLDPAVCRDVGGQPTPAYCKIILAQMAVLAGTVPGQQRAPTSEILRFVNEHLRSVRRKFRGASRRYVESGLRSPAQGPGPAALILSVPPSHVAAWHDDWWPQQATSGDGPSSTPVHGQRVNVAALLAHPKVPPSLKQRLLNGHEFLWVTAPPSSRTDNYRSCKDYAELSGADLDRIRAAGFLEGPLPYVPWTVNSLGCVIKHVPRFKVRNALDLTRSGVNAACARLSCELDDVSTAVRGLRRGMLAAKFDIADAFHCWAVLARSCDYLGLRHPITGDYYRYRFLPFGAAQAPAFQQQWARAIQDLMRHEGLQFCTPGTPAADYDRFGTPGAYLDDFIVSWQDLSPQDAALAFWSLLVTLEIYGIPVKHEKSEWPHFCLEYTGFGLNLRDGYLWIAEERRARYAAELELLARGGPGSAVSRTALASVVGRLQWAVGAVPRGQAFLVECYRARNALLREDISSSSPAAWRPEVLVRLSPEACQEMAWWLARLGAPCVRRFFYDGCDTGLLWGREAVSLLPSDDDLFLRDQFFETVTTDASGWAGGAWWRHLAFHWAFTPEQLAGRFGGSSNLRELFMVPATVQQWGLRFRALRQGTVLLLFRLDNQASVGAVNTGASMVPEVNALLIWLHELEDFFDVRVVARYLPGVLNVRADGISRLRGALDDQDWQLRPSLFAQLAASWGPFDVDACSDPLGRNAHCPVFWSELNSCLDNSWSDLHVYCNPPFRAATEILHHFRACWERAPSTSSAVFVLPVWPSEGWWRLLAGGRVVAYWPPGSSVFTSPDWRLASRSNPVPSRRVDRGTTRWPVVVILFPHTSVSLAASRSAQVPSDLPVLSGRPERDRLLLRRMPPGVVLRLPSEAGHGRPRDVPVLFLPPFPSRPPDDEPAGGVDPPGGR